MRRQPVAFFLGDAAFLSDAKFRALMRRLTEPDEFNSAVGAYFIALAAARRNGLPDIDVAAETGSSFLEDLCAVGLLCESGFPEKPFREWAPSRPKYPSDLRHGEPAPSAPSVPSATDSPFTPAREPSPPLSSISTPSGGGVGEGLPNLNSAVASMWLDATGRSVLGSGAYAAEYLDDACRRHPPSEVAAAVIRARKTFDHIPEARPLILEMKKILDPFLTTKATPVEDTAKRAARTKRDMQLTKHSGGYHIDAPDPDCPKCKEGAA